MAEQRKLLITMLDAVYVDTVDEKAIVTIRPKLAFRPLFEIATTLTVSGVVLKNQTPQALDEPEAFESYCWWRRGRVEHGLVATELPPRYGKASQVEIGEAKSAGLG